MLSILFSFLIPLQLNLAQPPGWMSNIDQAMAKARQEHKYILLNFSGSDWCGPCIRMHQEIFNTEQFQEMAARKLVMVNADFPRSKKNQLSAEQQKLNEQLADRYNPKGYFPYTLLLDENGAVMRSWEGFYSGGAGSFTELVDKLTESVY
jgi:thioredoxin-related protein